MIDSNNDKYHRILIINNEDIIPLNEHYFKGKRYSTIFIHKDNLYKDDFKIRLQPTIMLLGYQFGNIYEYE